MDNPVYPPFAPDTVPIQSNGAQASIKKNSGEIQHIDAMPEKYLTRQQGFVASTFRKLFGGESRKLQDSPERDIAMDYRAIRQEALDKEVSLIADAG